MSKYLGLIYDDMTPALIRAQNEQELLRLAFLVIAEKLRRLK